MRHRSCWLASLPLLAHFSGPAGAAGSEVAGPIGVWTRPAGGQIEVHACGAGIGMKVLKAEDPAHVGRQIMCDAKLSGINRWQGELTNLEDGNTYAGTVTLTETGTLKLEGCVLGGLICKAEEWRR